MKKPSVMIIIDTYIIGGPGKGILQFIKYHDKKMFSYVIVCFKRKGMEDTEFIKKATEENVTVEVIVEDQTFNRKVFKDCLMLAEKYHVNIVQSHGYKGHLLSLFLKIKTNVKWISFSHGWTSENKKMRLYNLLEKCLVVFADIAVGVSKKIKKTLMLFRFGRKTINIINAIEIISFRSNRNKIRSKYNFNQNTFIFTCIGRLSPEKGQIYLLKAFKEVLVHYDRAILMLVGDGYELEYLKKWVIDNGISERVKLAGYQSNALDYIADSNVVVIPSLSEGIPNVALEAMMMKIPVIATNVGGVGEILEDKRTGIIVKSKSVDSLKNAMLYSISNYNHLHHMTQAAYNVIKYRLNPEIRAEQIQQLYNKLSENEIPS